MMSEDFDYCSRLPDGAWMAEVVNDEGTPVSWLDYGHIGEKVLVHEKKPHILKDDRGHS